MSGIYEKIKGDFMSGVMDKIASTHPSYVPQQSTTVQLDTSRVLTRGSDDPIMAAYASYIGDNSVIGDSALTAFSKLDPSDKSTVRVLKDGQEVIVDAVGTNVEHYFTWQVFYNKAYETAIIDLLGYRADYPYTLDESNLSLQKIIKLAEMNGEPVDLNEVKAAYDTRIEAYIDTKLTELSNDENIIIDQKYIDEYATYIKEYYKNPNGQTLSNLILAADHICKKYESDDSIFVHLRWNALINDTISSISPSLAMLLIDNADKVLTTQTETFEPVELVQSEKAIKEKINS